MTSYARQERAAIADSFLRLGPDAPTIDDPWLARDLAAHLVIRDSRPDLSAGMFVGALKGRLDEAMREHAATDYAALVDRVRQGPPGWSPARIGRVDEVVNGGEFFIHHEDLLRGTPGFERRTLDVGHERFLWDMLKRGSRLYFRSVPDGRRPRGRGSRPARGQEADRHRHRGPARAARGAPALRVGPLEGRRRRGRRPAGRGGGDRGRAAGPVVARLSEGLCAFPGGTAAGKPHNRRYAVRRLSGR